MKKKKLENINQDKTDGLEAKLDSTLRHISRMKEMILQGERSKDIAATSSRSHPQIRDKVSQVWGPVAAHPRRPRSPPALPETPSRSPLKIRGGGINITYTPKRGHVPNSGTERGERK